MCLFVLVVRSFGWTDEYALHQSSACHAAEEIMNVVQNAMELTITRYIFLLDVDHLISKSLDTQMMPADAAVCIYII